jgi:hypothetical protein
VFIFYAGCFNLQIKLTHEIFLKDQVATKKIKINLKKSLASLQSVIRK